MSELRSTLPPPPPAGVPSGTLGDAPARRAGWAGAGGPHPASPGTVAVDAEWQVPVSAATALKDALDDVLRWSTPAPGGDAALTTLLAKYGLDITHARSLSAANGGRGWQHYFPDHFVYGVLLGQWCKDEVLGAGSPLGWVRLPCWSVLGGVRQERYRDSPLMPAAEAQEKVSKLEADVIKRGQHDTSLAADSGAIAGIPLFWSGEGKNRRQLHRIAGVPVLTRLHQRNRPESIDQVELRRVAFLPLGVVRYGGKAQILPFPDLSGALLALAGAQVRLTGRPSLRGLALAMKGLVERYGVFNALRAVGSCSAVRLAWLTKRPDERDYRDPAALFKKDATP